MSSPLWVIATGRYAAALAADSNDCVPPPPCLLVLLKISRAPVNLLGTTEQVAGQLQPGLAVTPPAGDPPANVSQRGCTDGPFPAGGNGDYEQS